MDGRISIVGNDILCECGDRVPASTSRIPLKDNTIERLQNWMHRYRRAVRSDEDSDIPVLGAEIFIWLDESGWASRWTRGSGRRGLEVAVNETESEAARALLGIPWEALMQKGEFLAFNKLQPFAVFRSIGRRSNATPVTPERQDIAMMFMAAAPEGEIELDFEAEEAAILKATKALPLQVAVEEIGRNPKEG